MEEADPDLPRIRVMEGGPLLVEHVPLARVVKTASDELVEGPPSWIGELVETSGHVYAICRCGGTSTGPFCDRWPHRQPCFDESGGASASPVPLFTWRLPDGVDGPLAAIKANGPLRVSGGVPIERADGSVVDPGERASLCRCGSSRTMPFCDSSHKVVGFRDA